MNSIISKAFVFINEVLSTILVGFVLLVGLIMMAQGYFISGLLTASLGTVFLVCIFGFAAIMIENHKLLKDIRDHFSPQTGDKETSGAKSNTGKSYGSKLSSGEIKCQKCGEISVDEAEKCWSCGASLK